MERLIPDLYKHKLLDVFFNDDEERTKANYLIHLYQLEQECEKTLLNVLEQLDFQASVKKDKYTLPFKEEITHTILGGSDLQEAFNFSRAARTIVKTLLDINAYKFRFYMYINIIEGTRNFLDVIPPPNADTENFVIQFGAIEYRFRYYLH